MAGSMMDTFFVALNPAQYTFVHKILHMWSTDSVITMVGTIYLGVCMDANPILSHGPIGSESWVTVPKGGISMGLMMKILFMHTNTYLNDDIVKILSLSSAETKQYTILKPGIILWV